MRTTGRVSGGLIYVRVEAGSTELARARLADGAALPVTRTPGRDETWPYWSDTARRVVFQVGQWSRAAGNEDDSAARQSLPKSDLVFWDPESGTETPLFDTPYRSERWPAWSPDGRFVVFAFLGRRPAAGIARYEVASGATELLTTTTRVANLLRPSFSPSGRRLSLEQRGQNGKGSQLRILSVTPGSELRSLTSDAHSIDTKGFFARNGEEILFTRVLTQESSQETTNDRTAGQRRRVYRVSTSGGDARPVFEAVTKPSEKRNKLDEHSARPSPTRDEFAFVSNRNSRFSGNDSELYVAELDGDGVRRLTHTPAWSEYAPRWSPDGERIVVTVVPSKLSRPRLVEPAELAQIRLRVYSRDGDLLFDEPGMMADWMPPWP